MMRRLAFPILAILPMMAAASAPVAPDGSSLDERLDQAQTEAKQAADRLSALEAGVAKAEGTLQKAAAERAAAGAAIEDAEARISAADAEYRLAKAQLATSRSRLERAQAPAAALLAGLVISGRQPALATLAGASPEELVRVRALVDATLPIIRMRSAALAGELAAQQKASDRSAEALANAKDARALLAKRQQAFAELEAKSAGQLRQAEGLAIGAGDRAMASDEQLRLAQSDAEQRRESLASAAVIAQMPLSDPRPMPGDAPLPAPDFDYSLPVDGPIIEGVGSVSDAGIVARGIRFDTARGATVRAPADGRILFAAPFRRQDGIVIIDHGDGRTSLLINVSSTLPRGTKVSRGETIGRAIGPVDVEFRQKGHILSPAFIAASSPPLSNDSTTR